MSRLIADRVMTRKQTIQLFPLLLRIPNREVGMLTQERVQELFVYDKGTGILLWRRNKGRASKGSEAGCASSDGYRRVGVDGEHILYHRLIWLYVNGYVTENQIDHINRDRLDNRLCNLREVTQACNLRNKVVYLNNKSGVRGVRFDKSREKWFATIGNGKSTYVGISSDFTEAVAHRLAAEQFLGWEGCNFDSPAYKHIEEWKACQP